MFGIGRFNEGGCLRISMDFRDSITEKYLIYHALYLPQKVQIYTNKRIRVRVEDTRNHNEDICTALKYLYVKHDFFSIETSTW